MRGRVGCVRKAVAQRARQSASSSPVAPVAAVPPSLPARRLASLFRDAADRTPPPARRGLPPGEDLVVPCPGTEARAARARGPSCHRPSRATDTFARAARLRFGRSPVPRRSPTPVRLGGGGHSVLCNATVAARTGGTAKRDDAQRGPLRTVSRAHGRTRAHARRHQRTPPFPSPGLGVESERSGLGTSSSSGRIPPVRDPSPPGGCPPASSPPPQTRRGSHQEVPRGGGGRAGGAGEIGRAHV